MALSPGTRLGPYEIIALLGKGGMGEVYRARDTRLLREVAIKVSASRFSERFEREARAIAALNHPNICTLHDIGPDSLIMEYVDGKPIKGPLPLDQVTRIASQIAAALEAAHAKGIVHRDLKPANILIKPDGAVKVLDFGLAKLTQSEFNRPDDPTFSLTAAGSVMGTAAYMAPEQAEGREVDKRADIWAFGVILYELLSGQRLFNAPTAQETLMQVLTRNPDLTSVPVQAHALLRRCLERDPNRRLRDIGDAMPLLEQVPIVVTATARTSWWWPALAAAAICLALAFVRFREPSPASPTLLRFRISLTAGLRLIDDAIFFLSPDGRTIAFPASRDGEKQRIWTQTLDSLEPHPIPGTEDSAGWFWSPDSKTIVMLSDGKLKRTDLAGNATQVLCQAPDLVLGGDWNKDDVLIFGTVSPTGIMRVPAKGGVPVSVTKVDASRQERHIFPVFLPDGQHFIYLRISPVAEAAGIYVGSLGVAPEAQPNRRLLATDTAARFVARPDGGGEILFLHDGSLMAQGFDLNRLELSGQPRRLAESVGSTRAFPFFAASASGNLVYRTAPSQTRQLTILDRRGLRIGELGQPLPLSDEPVLSPLGTQFAISQWVATDRVNDLFLYTFSPARVLRLVRGPTVNEAPVWSADGSRVAYSSRRGNNYDLYQVKADGDGQQLPMLESPENKFPSSWSPDGHLLFTKRGEKTSWDVWVLPPGHAKPVALLETAASETSGKFSPDGHWIAYLSDESGSTELYVRSFSSAPNGVGSRIPVSTGGASMPRWRADGRELFYIAPDGNLMSVPIASAPTLVPGQPAVVFKAPAPTHWDVMPDGKSSVFAVPVGQPTLEPFTVVVNWQAEQLK